VIAATAYFRQLCVLADVGINYTGRAPTTVRGVVMSASIVLTIVHRVRVVRGVVEHIVLT